MVYVTPGVISGGEFGLVVVVVEVVVAVEVTWLVVVAVVAPLSVPPLEMEEVVLEGGAEDDVFVAALLDECFPKVAPNAPPRTPPSITKEMKRPMIRFLRDQPRAFGDTAPSSRASAMSFSSKVTGGVALAPSLGRSA